MDKLERIGKQARYDDMIKPPSESAVAVGNRRPVYINYTPEGRKKEPCGSSHGRTCQKKKEESNE